MLVASYEAVRYKSWTCSRSLCVRWGPTSPGHCWPTAWKCLSMGTATNNGAEADQVKSTGTLTYEDLVSFWAKFDPYEMNALLVSGDVMVKLLKLTEFQNPLTGLNFQGTGKLTTPLGAQLLRTSVLPSGTAIGLDKRFALEMVQGSDVSGV